MNALVRRATTAPWILTAALVVHVVAFAISAVESPEPAGDFDRYYQIGSTAGRPYADYQVEHPIGTLLIFKSLARLPRGRASFGLGVVVLDLAGDAIIIASLVWGWGLVAAAYFAVTLIPVLGLFFNRIDAWSTAAAIVAVASWRRNRPLAIGIALAIGAAFKLWPLLFVPLLVVPWRGRGSLLALTAFIATAAALAGTALWLAGTNSVLQVLTFRGARGWQIESLVGNVLHLASARTLRLESGSWRVGATSGPVAVAMFLAAAPICLWSTWRGARNNRIGVGWLASVSALLLLSALLSAQFVIWLVPGAAIAWTDGDKRSAMVAALVVLTTQLFYAFYDFVLHSQTPALLLVLLRNAVLVSLAVCATTDLVRQRSALG
jgi:glycosyl transferase family 87